MFIWRITHSKDNKISAIKDLKEHFGLGLIDTKHAVDLGMLINLPIEPHDYETPNVKVFQGEMDDKEITRIILDDIREKLNGLEYYIKREITGIYNSLRTVDSIMRKE